MKNKFPLYYRPTDETKKALFHKDNCYFVFDTNALLDLYRLGMDTTEKVLSLIEKYKTRIVIPYHVAEEYHNDMLSVLTANIAMYHNVLRDRNDEKILDAIYDNVGVKKYPALKERLKVLMSDALKKFYEDVELEESYLREQFSNWELQNKISNSLGDKVLDGFSDAEIESIESEGQQRYENSVPPGYKDVEKESNKYGDLIIWKEILRFADEKKCSVIFISRDLKEDWIMEYHGMQCGPRYELIKEFKEVSEGEFLMCTLERFLEYANEEQKVLKDEDLKELKEKLAVAAWGKYLVEKAKAIKDEEMPKGISNMQTFKFIPYHKSKEYSVLDSEDLEGNPNAS